MATAKQPGGLYYIGETAVDANGVAIEGAPTRPKDTDPSKQPGAVGGPSETDRMAQAIATGIAAALKGMAPGAAAPASTDSDEVTELPTLSDLPAHLAALSTVAEVERMRDADERKGAQKLYADRIAELTGE